MKAQTRKIFAHTFDAFRVHVQRQQVAIRQLQHVRRLATGCCAGIEHPHAVLGVQQGRGQLRASILNRKQAIAKTR